jgi:small subunit ribosomal protein S17e
MGKVRTKLVKRVARLLFEKYPDLFTRDFQHNKLVVSRLVGVSSKKLRNQVAGYITHLVSITQKVRKTTMEEAVEEVKS